MQRLSLAALAERIVNQEPVAGLELVTTIGEQRIYRASVVFASCGDQVDCLDDVSVLDQVERVAAIEAKLAELAAEKEALLQSFNQSKAEQKSEPQIEQQEERSKFKRKADNKPLVWCQIDGCDIWMGAGAAIAKHRQLKHPEWFKRQQALADDHPLKVARNDLIKVNEATLTDNLPAVPTADAAHEVADEAIPFTRA